MAASFGSLPFLIEASGGGGGSAHLHSRVAGGRRGRLLVGCCRPDSVGPDGNGCGVRFPRVGSGRILVGFPPIGGDRGRKGQRAARKGGSFQGADDADDALNAAVDKSEKVRAMQKELLRKIVERRNLLSSIRTGDLEAEKDTLSHNQSDGDLSLNLTSSIEEPNGQYNNNIDSDSYAQSTEMNETSEIAQKNKISEEPHFGVNGNYVDNIVEPVSISQAKNLVPEILDLPKESNMETAKSKITSPFVLETFESYGTKDEKFEDRVETKVNSIDVKDVSKENEVDSPPLAGANVMNIILVAAECAPWSKTGGLGDVAGALPKALARRGHRVMVVAPRYGDYAEPHDIGVRKYYKVDGQDLEVSYFHAYIDGVDFVFMDSPVFRHLENNIYGGDRLAILKRMALFCKAAVEVPWLVPCGGVCYGDGNLAFIANDWHTALLPVYLKAYYRDNGLMKYARSTLVIHNIAHQGRGPVDDFLRVGLPEHYLEHFKFYDPVGGDHFNIFAAGLKTADRVVTVSHGYAWELRTAEGGWGLHNIINENSWKFQGIVNGIDTREWNPEFDAHLMSDGYINYSLETLQTGKPQCKTALQRELGLPVRDDVPVVAFIGRLDGQKGVDIIAEAMPWIVDQDVQLIMLGTGRPDLEDMLRRSESQHHDKVRGWVGFSVKMAHRITAGADVLLMPSRFEPCGLNQLYAMKYATIPVVHAVGGLRDTVTQFDPFSESGLGWTFDRAETNKLIEALGHCLNTYRNYKDSWRGLQTRGMMQDLSWDNAAQRYEEVLVAAKYQW